MGIFLIFVGSSWKFVFGYIKNIDTHHESFSSKKRVIKKLSPKSLWQTYMKWTVVSNILEPKWGPIFLLGLMRLKFAWKGHQQFWKSTASKRRFQFETKNISHEEAIFHANLKFLSFFLELTLSPPNKLSSATFLVCFSFQSASMSLKVCENVVRVSNSLDPGETASNSPSHPDPSCLHMVL